MRSYSNISTLLLLVVTIYSAKAQYTETINTNNPGRSQGAFSVGTGVVQAETSLFYNNQEHTPLRYERNVGGIAFQLRYGFFLEELELSYIGEFSMANQTNFSSSGNIESNFSNLSESILGVKYLVLDPIKVFGEKGNNLYSWRANNILNWKDFVPAVSVYAGANLNFSNPNSFIPPNSGSVSPRFEVLTQNNFGNIVFVMNGVFDRLGTDFPSYEYIATLTHTIGQKWAVFGEYQALISDFYSDDLLRGGATYLVSKDWQVDASATINFKDTPSIFQVNVGMSYRLDFHKDKEVKPEQLDSDGKKKKKKKKNKLNLEENEPEEDKEDDNGGGL
ncbi:MAG: transporter [Nonlabens sp.]